MTSQAKFATITDTVGAILNNRYPFIVPKYQRAYAWKSENIDDFLDDIWLCFKAKQSGTPESHFFGGIVSIETRVSTLVGREYDVVDGQQRLATFTIFLSLMAKCLDEIGQLAEKQNDSATAERASALARSITREIIGDSSGKVKLTLSKTDNLLFQALVSKGDDSLKGDFDSHKRLVDAFKGMKKRIWQEVRVKTNTPEQQYVAAETITSAFLNDCYAIHLTTDSRNQAYKLFQVLNDRGVGLSEGDLLRSTSLELLEEHPTEQEISQSHWDSILSPDEKNIDQFLRAYFASHVGRRTGKRTLFDQFSEHFFGYKVPISLPQAENILQTTSEMALETQNFVNLVEGNWPYPLENSQTTEWDRNRLKVLIEGLKHVLPLPLLLAACRHLDETTFSAIVQIIERFVFRYVIIHKRHAGAAGIIYYEYAKKIRLHQSFAIDEFKKDLTKLLDENAPIKLFGDLLKSSLVYKENGQNRTLAYFLSTLENYYDWFETGAKGAPKVIDKSKLYDYTLLQVEHIYPLNARSSDQDPALELRKNDIGNLTFLGNIPNAQASNKPFSEKKDIYTRSGQSLNKYIVSFDEWTLEALTEREEKVIEAAKSIFSVL